MFLYLWLDLKLSKRLRGKTSLYTTPTKERTRWTKKHSSEQKTLSYSRAGEESKIAIVPARHPDILPN